MSILDYSYTNARIRALKDRLFRRDFLESLVACQTLEEIINILSETAYGQHINQAVYLARGTRGVESGLRNNLVDSMIKLKTDILSRKALMLASPILDRWDIHNIKVILRAHHAGRPSKEAEESFVPVGKLSYPFLIELSRLTDLRQIIDMLYTARCPYFKPLRDNFTDYEKEKNLQEYEIELDKFYFQVALREISSRWFRILDNLDQNRIIARKMIQMEIDIINLLTAMRISPSVCEEEKLVKLFIKNGKEVKFELFRSIYEKELIDEKLEFIRDTPFGKKARQAFDDAVQTGFISPLQRRLEELVIREAVALFKVYPLSIAPVIAYIWAKYNEVVNLRIIIRGKEAGLPDEKILKSLILF